VKARSPEAWRRLVKLYGPVVYGWCRRSGLQAEDAADVTQEVFRAAAGSVTTFRHDRPGDTFRGWLWTITGNKIKDHWRRQKGRPDAVGGTDAQRRLASVAAEESADLGSDSGASEAPGVARRALELIRSEFEDRTWQAFWRTAVDGQSPAAVADDLGKTANAVYVARSRVLRRLHEELDGLVG